MIDTHCHLTMLSNYKEDLEEARREGVNIVVTVGTDWEDSKKVKEIVERNDNVYGIVGIHPHESKRYKPSDVEDFLSLLDNKILGFGEVGLDFYKNYSPRENQISIFEAFVELASSKGIPLVIHTRSAEEKTAEILESQRGKLKGIIHCFSGSKDFARRMLDLGFYISFAGNITYKPERSKELVHYIPVDRILLETDAPFLSPVPVRGKKNKPSYVKYTYKFLSEVLNIPFKELEERIDENFKNLFGI